MNETTRMTDNSNAVPLQGDPYRLIFASDGFAVMNAFNLLNAGYVSEGGVLTSEHNNKVSLHIREADLDRYGRIGHEIFSSAARTRQLIDDINELIRAVTLLDAELVAGAESYADSVLAKNLEKAGALSCRFISHYRLLESQYTFYTEDVISQYVSLNAEGLRDKTVFDVIFNERGQIMDESVRTLCENVALLAEFKLSTKTLMYGLFTGPSALLREVRKRFSLSDEDDLRLLSQAEMCDFLIGGFDRQAFDQRARERRDWFVIMSGHDGKAEIFTGLEARSMIEDIQRRSGLEEESHTLKELSGQTASLGMYAGRAVVIPYITSKKDEAYQAAVGEFRQGDVLVTKNSVPEIMEIIMKAGAIVTEEGGITCHGAVMSREFKVPGIVGVAGVTDHVRTGDMIEVDARGIRGKISILNP